LEVVEDFGYEVLVAHATEGLVVVRVV